MVKLKVLFVCLGNICRSPMAEAVFQRMVDEAGLADRIAVDSAGTGSWHVGEPAHAGTRRILQEHGIAYRGRARQVTAGDLDDPHAWIIAMDQSNLATLRDRFGPHNNLHLLLDFAPNVKRPGVPDPYYDGNFAEVYELVEQGCRGLLEAIRAQEGIRS